MPETSGQSLCCWVNRWLAPSFMALVFCLNPAAVLLNPEMPLKDPGTGWHLVTGRLVLETGRPMTEDVFSFTQAGKGFVGGAWLFQAAAAWCERLGGLPLVTAVCALLYAWVPVLLYRRMLAERVPAPVALVFCGLAFGVLMVHSLDRPHIVTYLLFAWLLSTLWAFRRGDIGARAVFIHVPLMIVWCNCHRGFAVGLLLVAIFAAASFADRVVGRRTTGWGPTRTLVGLFVAMAGASVINPWGWGLHASTAEYLGMESIRYWNEYRSPDFLSGGSAVVAFEVMILTLVVALAFARARLDWLEVLLVVLFLHWGLQSLRHTNLFAIIAAPPIARGIWSLCGEFPALARRLADMGRQQAALAGGWLQIGCASATLLVLALRCDGLFRRDFDGIWLSRGAVDYIEAHMGNFARPFNTDDLGGSLIYRFWPRLRVFVDDRNEVYGDRFILDEYFAVREIRPNWREVLDRHGVDSAIVDSGSVQDTLLGSAAGWRECYRDGRNVIFAHGPNAPIQPR
ncbi:MAG TPA: hypothetical protein PLU30_19195 [Verrucomicrobiae bacterium]|nr:hypothetical protein [Verrucomicrobiae bacterium]